MREARLRPEFAHLYPGLTPGKWEPAARVAEAVLSRLQLLELTEAPTEERVLSGEHFEFRGGGISAEPRRTLRERLAERPGQRLGEEHGA